MNKKWFWGAVIVDVELRNTHQQVIFYPFNKIASVEFAKRHDFGHNAKLMFVFFVFVKAKGPIKQSLPRKN